MSDKHVNLIITVRNRVQHFMQTFPSFITQYGINYNIVLVDFGSNDNFLEILNKEIKCRKIMFSPYLKDITCIRKIGKIKFNPRSAKNLGVFCVKDYGHILAFSDVDTFIGMDYICYWSNRIEKNKSFFTTRQQESMAALPKRLKPEINYGNVIVFKSDFMKINGWDESVNYYGGDDDDLFHRLKLMGLREINPITYQQAKQYSILHGDELRTRYMKTVNKVDKKKSFSAIYNNKNFRNSKCDHLRFPNEFKIYKCHSGN
jgi:glycosyltransferase involved in cell wall biosynthesis